MNFNFWLQIRDAKGLDETKLSKAIEKTLNTILNLECGILDEKCLENQAKRINTQLESYANKLTSLHSTLELVTSDLALQKTKKGKQNSQKQKGNPHLNRIQRFFIDLPPTSEFDKLRFLQSLVKQSLESPEVVEGVMLQAFENYHREYAKKYLVLLQSREEAIKLWKKKEKEIKQKLFALISLDEVKALGKNMGKKFEKELMQLCKNHESIEMKEIEIKKQLQASPYIASITFSTPHPQSDFEDFEAKLDEALERKFTTLREKGVLSVLKNSKDASIQKLTKLINLSDFAKIVKLFTPKTSKKLIQTLNQLTQTK